FDRLRTTAVQRPAALTSLNFNVPFIPREGQPHFHRARDRRRTAPDTKPGRRLPDEGRKRWRPIEGPLTTADAPNSVRRFFHERVAPRRMPNAPKQAIKHAVVAVNRLCAYLGREALIEDLCAELLAPFMQWVT